MRLRNKQTNGIHAATLLIAAAITLALLFWPEPADASYRPAPANIRHAALAKKAPRSGTPAKRAWVICQIWPRRHCIAAINISWCEATIRPWAGNGQYQGAFQMGSSERARFGHGRTIWNQARAAHRYWKLSGWGPWQCRP